jgi:hypothetical protein
VKDAADLARAWLGKADRDLAAAKLCAGETQTTDAAAVRDAVVAAISREGRPERRP